MQLLTPSAPLDSLWDTMGHRAMAKSVLQGKGQIRCDPPYTNRGLGGLGGMGLGRGLSRAGAPGTAMSSTLLGPPMEGMTLKQEDGGCGTGGGFISLPWNV